MIFVKWFNYEQWLRVIGSRLYKGCLMITGSQLSYECMYIIILRIVLDKLVVLRVKVNSGKNDDGD